MSTGFQWPLVTFMHGRPTFKSQTYFKFLVGSCSHGERWQVRIDALGRFACVVVRKP